METEKITWGETYSIAVKVGNSDGVPLDPPLDGTWRAKCVVTRERVGGEVIASLNLPIADGAASLSVDTGNSPWLPGNYFYDVRITDSSGNDYWSDVIKLVLLTRNTPAS